MSTTPTQIRIDTETKNQAVQLFADLGLDLSGAVNMFLRQCVMRGGLPFAVEKPRYSEQTLAAIKEARENANNPDWVSYDSFEAFKTALES